MGHTGADDSGALYVEWRDMLFQDGVPVFGDRSLIAGGFKPMPDESREAWQGRPRVTSSTSAVGGAVKARSRAVEVNN